MCLHTEGKKEGEEEEDTPLHTNFGFELVVGL
jgi:hypothetical protein